MEQNQQRTVSFVDVSNRDNYIGQESRSESKVISLPETVTVSNNLNTLDDHTTKVVTTTTEAVLNININKANNSIDIHRLQKNIDNWTIQVCIMCYIHKNENIKQLKFYFLKLVYIYIYIYF